MIRFLLTFFLMATPVLAQVEARSLAVSDHVLYLGTNAGAIYTSHDDGKTWQGLAQFRKDYVIDRMLIDGERIYVAAWVTNNPSEGVFLRSPDKGKTWELTANTLFRAMILMDGCFIRACTGKMIYAGGPDGIYVSYNAGGDFTKVDSPIKDVQSIAVNDGTIYVGTWHLGWYTHNDGVTWHPISKGIIDDSDFFAILLSGSDIYIGACSGIYKGSDDGEQYRKLKTQKEARRTKVIRMGAKKLLYAGTTDGVFQSVNGGYDWHRQGNRNIVVNDMLVTSPLHLVVATSRFSVIWSDDGGKNYTQAQF